MVGSRVFIGWMCLSLCILPVSAFSQGANLPAFDKDFPCIEAPLADKIISDFRINVQSFGGKELCNSSVDTKKLLNDLTIVRDGQFMIPVTNHPLVKGFIPADQYYSWAVRQTRGIRRGNDVPYATAYNSGGYFTMQDGWAILSTLGRVGTFLHEARHTAGYSHEICNQGPYQNTSVSGCDANYNYGGSHAVEIEYYARVALYGTNFSPTYKQMARLMALARGNFVFNIPVIRPENALLVKTTDQHFYLVHKDEISERFFPHHDGVLKRSSAGASIFNGKEAYSLEIYASRQSNIIDDDYTYFKFLQQDRGQGQGLVDLEEFDIQGKRYVYYLKPSELAGYNFGEGHFNSSSALNFQARRFATYIPRLGQGLFVVGAQNEIFSINPENQSFKKTAEIWDGQIESYAQSDNADWTLKSNGELSNSAGLTFNKPVEQMVAIPLYDSFVVEKE